MDNSIIKERLHQLLKIYVYAEQQYLHTAINQTYPVLEIFYEQRAIERSDLMLQIQHEIDVLDTICFTEITIDAFFMWHQYLYGGASLCNWPVTDIYVMNIDEKALEICTRLLYEGPPKRIYKLIEHHLLTIQSSLLSFAYLKALYKHE